MGKDNEYGLDWWTNSEHGGVRSTDGNGNYWDNTALYPAGTIQGCVKMSGGHQQMWRWQSLRDYAYQDILNARTLYPDRQIFSGVEWNVPGHEHCSVGILAPNAEAVSDFEYIFDNSDDDTSRNGEATPYAVLQKLNGKTYTGCTPANKSYPERHSDAVQACSWLQEQYENRNIDAGWIVFAHVERAGAWNPSTGGGYNIENFRDFNNAGPDVCFGFEGAPGHQANGDPGEGRGSFNPVRTFGGTYGGVGFYSATVGGLWDALLGEGRKWSNFASSDYHRRYDNCSPSGRSANCGDDFYPGEYQRTWVNSIDKDSDGKHSMQEIADGLRSGKAFFVTGDLIDYLDFSVQNEHIQAGMGGNLPVKEGARNLKITIKFKSPPVNKHGDRPVVDHIDLIAGEISGKISKYLEDGFTPNPDYSNAANPTTKVIASFSSKDWEKDEDGNNVIVYHIKNVDMSMYFRLRGTNLACNTPNETGPAVQLPSADYCKPLPDQLVADAAFPVCTASMDDVTYRNCLKDRYQAAADEAWKDLWFYSNPIFVHVNH